MTVILNVDDKAIVATQPTSELIYTDVALTLYDLEEQFNLTISMTEAKGREIVEKLTKQLDKVDEISQHRKASQKKMIDSIRRLQEG